MARHPEYKYQVGKGFENKLWIHIEDSENYYPINYGFVEGIIAPDGEEQDAYILGVDVPVKEFVGNIIAYLRVKQSLKLWRQV